MRKFCVYNPDVPGAKEAAEKDYRRHNMLVAGQLRAAGLFPGGDINACLRTGGGRRDNRDPNGGFDDR